MTTIYIKGREGCKKAIRKALGKSKLKEGDHYIEGVNSMHETTLYWITSRISLKEFKLGISSKVIWEYRLTFYENVEDLIPKKVEELSLSDIKLLKKLRIKWE